MTGILTATIVLAVIYGAAFGTPSETGSAAFEGAGAAVQFILGTGGILCLWSGVLEVMRRAKLTDALSSLLEPVLRRLFPRSSRDREVLNALSANVAANLLGLGNAATPMGIKAAKGMARLGQPGVAGRELCLLVVINTASIQLLPTTVAAVRASAGASAPFDILPAVWISSIVSVTAGILAAKLFAAFCGE